MSRKKSSIALPFLLIASLISFAAKAEGLKGYLYGDNYAQTGNEWQNPELLALNKLQPHAWFFSFENTEAARRVLPYESKLWQSLNGTWKFNWAPDPDHRPEGFYSENYDVSGWDDLTVPGCWNVQGIQKDGSLKYGVPIYCNQPVIFQHKVAVDDWRGGVMREPKEDWVTYRHRNEVGSYRRSFTIPANWQDKEVYISFDGVNSFFYLWINGRYVGFSKNSRTTASFDITRFLKPGENSVAVEVYRNSDGSFLEAQDMWRLPGIYRSVSLQAKPKMQISDLIVRTTDLKKGTVKVEANLFNGQNIALNNLTLSYNVYQCKLWEDENSPVKGLQGIAQKIDVITADSHLPVITEIAIPNALWWSSETPYRYILVGTLKDEHGQTLETVSTYFGVKQVEIHDTKAEEDEFGLAGRYFYVNGKPIKLKGVNRQEINLATGNTITHDQITEEVMLMRRGNINHVRTSHYSNDPFWFYTCDKYGIYLEDEANIESHEYYYGKASLSHVAEFRNAHIARVMEAAHAHVNSPCVVIWSLGNEAGPGDNFKAAYAALHDFDPTRPVQYERNNDIVDMGSNQYPGIDWIREAVKGRMTDIKYPFHVSEYAHSMGNAGGNLEDYWAAIESTNFFCGAAIWDWVDQALWNYTPNGTRYMAYGGDFGDKPNDNTFCMNGILFPDHTPKPEFEEVKKVYQYYDVVGVGNDSIEVHNKHYFVPNAQVKLLWSLYKDGIQISEPQLLADTKALPAPRERKLFALPIDRTTLDANAEYFVRLQFVQTNDVPWAKQGYVQAEEELLLQTPALKNSAAADANLKALHSGEFTYQQSETKIDIQGKDFAVTFDNETGTLARLSYHGKEYITPGNGPQFNGYRAAVDNDNWWGPVSWIDNGLWNMEAKSQGSAVVKMHDTGILEIQYNVQCQGPDADSLFIVYAKQIWYVYPDGSIELKSGLHASDPEASLARCGYAMKFDKSLDQYAYYGRGPRNNYADRCSGSMHALYRSSVQEMFEPFPRPQDMANRQDVRWCALTDRLGQGLQFVLYPNDAEKKGCASVLPYSDLDLAYAEHPYQLPVSDGTYLHLDAAVTGLGGNSCGQGGPLEEDRVTAQDRTFGFMIRPLMKNDDATLIASSKVVSEFDEPLNQIAGIRKLNATTAEIITHEGGIVTVDFYGDNLFRLFFDPSGKEMRNPTAEPQAEILVKQPREAGFAGITINEDEHQVSVGSASTRIVFDRHSGLFSLYRNGQKVVSQQRHTDFGEWQYHLYLHQQPEEYFYGGGVQNGRFSHRGEQIEIVNTNSWTDGGVTSPAPFYWSTGGYGVMCHTFEPGLYDFGKSQSGVVDLSHYATYLDLFFFTGNNELELLNGYYQLTGHPVLLPKFGFYEGHLNAYNRDYWRLADSSEYKAIKFEDSRYYKEAQKDNGGIKESLNGELENYQFSARGVVDRYARHDMPLGWILPNDGYGAGYGQTETLDGNIANLKSFGEYARSKGVEIGLWTQSNLHPIDSIPALLQRDIIKEVRDAGVRVLKTDVAWVGDGYSFGLNGISEVADIIPYYGHNARPFIITLDGWAGTQRYGTIWSGDQTGGKWEYIRFHIPTYIGAGLSGLGNITSDMDGIYGGAKSDVQIRDFEWKTFTPMQLNMDGWGHNPKYPHALGEPAASINRSYLKWKSMLLPYTYSCSHEAIDGKPLMRAMFLEFPNDYTRGPRVCYQYMYGPSFLIAPVYQATNEDAEGNDIRNDIYLPQGQWIDYFNGDTYEVSDPQGVTLSNYDAPIWKLPVFVRPGAIIPMHLPSNNPSQIDKSQLLIEVYPSTETSSFLLYDDDGKTEAYLDGEYASLEISQQLSGKGSLNIKMQPKELNYPESYLQNEVALTFLVNTTSRPRKVTLGKKKLQEVHSEEELRNTPNSYFFNEAPELNRFATPGSEFSKRSIKKNAQLWIHTEPVDLAAEINLKVEGVAFVKPVQLASKQGVLAAPAEVCVADSARTPYTLTPSWKAVENADYYEMRFEGQLYTAIRDTHLLLSELKPETRYDIEVRAVNADGVSSWATISAQTLESPFKYAISGITAETNGAGNDEHEVYRLFDFFTGGDIWFDTKEEDKPYIVTMDLQEPQHIERMEYLPREGGGNGGIQECSIEISLDGDNYIPCGNYTWEDDEATKTVTFEGNPEVRYIRMSITKSRGNYVAGREMLIFKTK